MKCSSCYEILYSKTILILVIFSLLVYLLVAIVADNTTFIEKIEEPWGWTLGKE